MSDTKKGMHYNNLKFNLQVCKTTIEGIIDFRIFGIPLVDMDSVYFFGIVMPAATCSDTDDFSTALRILVS